MRYNIRNDDAINEEDVDANLTGDIIPGFIEYMNSLNLEEEKYHFSIEIADADENHDTSAIKINCFL